MLEVNLFSASLRHKWIPLFSTSTRIGLHSAFKTECAVAENVNDGIKISHLFKLKALIATVRPIVALFIRIGLCSRFK